MDSFQEQLDRVLKKDHDLLEEWCERMLQTGTHGVLVRRRQGLILEIGLDPTVPYGNIYEFIDNQ